MLLKKIRKGDDIDEKVLRENYSYSKPKPFLKVYLNCCVSHSLLSCYTSTAFLLLFFFFFFFFFFFLFLFFLFLFLFLLFLHVLQMLSFHSVFIFLLLIFFFHCRFPSFPFFFFFLLLLLLCGVLARQLSGVLFPFISCSSKI